MAAPAPSPITFVLAGSRQVQQAAAAVRSAAPPSLPAGLTRGRIKQSARVGAQRGGARDIRMVAIPGEDVVVLHVAGGPALVLHPESARDLLLAQAATQQDRGAGRTRDDEGEVRVPASLQWTGLDQDPTQRGRTRGAQGSVRLSAIEIVTGLGTDIAADFAASEVVRRVDAQVDPGVFRLSVDALPKLKGTRSPPRPIPSAPDGEPLLVLLHGTMSETSGSFSQLWIQHPQLVRSLFEHYGNRVYGLEHPTLGVSPIENALALARACPTGGRLHLLSHSRGGLVAEVLARVCARPHLGARDFAFFKGDEYREQRASLKALGKVVAERRLRVERVVRVACPSRGTLLASKRLDAYVSILKWTLELAGIPVAPAIVDFLGEVAQRRADPERLPGLAAQIPDSPLVALAQYGRRPDPGRFARRRGRHRGRLGDVLGQDVAGRRVLLDRQRPGRADALDVRRHSAHRRRNLPVRPGRESLPLQLFSQRPYRRRHRRCTRAADAAGVPGHRTVVVGRRIVRWRSRRGHAHEETDERQARGVRAAGHPWRQPQGRRQAHLALGDVREQGAGGRDRLAPGRAEDQRDQRRSHVRPPAPLAGALHVDASDGNGACRRSAARWRHDHCARHRPLS